MPFPQRLPAPRAMLWTGGVLVSASAAALLKLLGVSLVVSVLILVTILLVILILVLLRQLRQAKSAREIEKTITRQADADIERSSPGKAAETQGLKADLLEALQALKSSTVARRGGERALSILPWYMLIGPSGSGKGSLVRKAGLHFLLLDSNQQPRSIQGVGGTRGIEWLLSQEAVLLDMAGRTLGAGGTEGDEDWVSFLQVLRKQRKAKALNGLIVGVPLDRIADSGEAEIKTLARSIRDRLQELIHQLRTVFPVYLVFTKADRLAGFSEFFADLDAAEQARPWGATLSLERSRGDKAEILFDEEFAVLTAALSDRRMLRLPGVPDPIQRARVFAFPLQLEAVRSNARSFIRILFEPDPVQESPFFRGFYFASSGQEGPVVDRVLEPAARSLGIAPPAAPTPAAAGGAFFSQDLFRQVIFPDASLATPSTRGKIGQSRRRVVLFALLAVLLLTLVISLGVLNAWNGQFVSETRRAAQRVANLDSQAALMEQLQSLDRLRAQAAQVESFSKHTPFLRWLGCYSGNVLKDPTIELYCERASTLLVDRAARDMALRLSRMNETGEGRFIDYYYLYYAWRLLTTQEPRALVPDDAPILAREMNRSFSSDPADIAPEMRTGFPRMVADQAAFLASHSRVLKRHTGAGLRNTELEERGNWRVRRTWDSYQFYADMRDSVRQHTEDLRLDQLVAKPEFIRSERPVSGPFTKEAWDGQVRPRIEAHRSRMERYWLVSGASGAERPDLANELLRHYADAYSREWAAFLDSLTIQQTADVGVAAERLQTAAQSDSPILKLLEKVRAQTGLGLDPTSPMAKVQEDFRIADEFFIPAKEAGPAHKIFTIHQKFMNQGPGQDALDPTKSWKDRYLRCIQRVAEWKKKKVQSGAPAIETANLAAGSEQQDNPIASTMSQIDELEATYKGDRGAAPVARLLRLPISYAGPPCETLNRDLSEKWARLVLQPFLNTLSGKYPFDPNATTEATIPDFTEFFRPGGIVWKFHSEYLKDLVEENGTPLSEQIAPCFSQEFYQCLQRAYEIREAFFVGGSQEASLRFSVQTETPSQDGRHVPLRGVYFEVGGDRAQYEMGAPIPKEVVWPGAAATQGAALGVQAVQSELEVGGLVRTGVWGLFRLLDGATMGQSADGQYPTAQWTVSAGLTRITPTYEFHPSSAHHPFQRDFLRFTVPSGL